MANTAAQPRIRARGNPRFLFRSLVFLLAVAGVVALLHRPLVAGFEANAYLNGTIVGVLGFGIGYTLVVMVRALLEGQALGRARRLLANFEAMGHPKQEVTDLLFRLKPGTIGDFLATVHRVVRSGEASATLPYLLDSLATRSEDRRALVRFLTGALILLGLIGTFYGLLITIDGVKEVLGGLSAQTAQDTMGLLTSLRERLAQPMGGMALAFSSSLFGLSASLILAFLELQLFHAQSDVHARMESLVVSELVPFWELGAGRHRSLGGEADRGYIAALLQNTAEHLERMAGQLDALRRGAGGADRLSEATQRLSEQLATLGGTLDRLETDRTAELRNELRLMTKTLSTTLAQRDAHAAQG
jgi:hypothetical protein